MKLIFLIYFTSLFNSWSLDVQEKFIPQSGSVEASVSVSTTGVLTASSIESLGTVTATGITFGGETLSVYSEGTWTPADGSGAGLSFSSVSAKYTRVGRLVVASFNLTYPATADATAAKVSGLPYNTSGDTLNFGYCSFDQTLKDFAILGQGGTDDIVFYQRPGGAAITNLDLSSSVVWCTLIFTS